MDATEILTRVRARYRDCTYYRDSGTTALRADQMATFTTEYRRDVDELCFTYKVEVDEWLELKGAGGKVVSYRSSPPELAADIPVTSETPLRRVVGTIAGITFGSAKVVPALLTPDSLGKSFQGECAILKRERLEGEPCVWIYFGSGFAVAVEIATSRIRHVGMFLSDVVSSDGRVKRDSGDPALPLGARAQMLTSYEVHELS